MAGPAIGQIRPFGIIFTGVLPSKKWECFQLILFICMYYYFVHHVTHTNKNLNVCNAIYIWMNLPQHVLGSNKYYVCTIGINSYTYIGIIHIGYSFQKGL